MGSAGPAARAHRQVATTLVPECVIGTDSCLQWSPVEFLFTAARQAKTPVTKPHAV